MDLCELREFDHGPRHPWEMARLALIEGIVRRHVGPSDRLLEVGCGDGFVVGELVERLALPQAVGIDPFLTDEQLQAMNERSGKVQFVRDGGGDELFGLATLLDVLEHVEDDRALLRGAVDRLRDDGIVMITVPACPRLMSSHDRFMSHYRRYSRASLDALLSDCKLVPVESGSLFGSLAFIRSLEVLREKTFGESAAPKGLAGWRFGAGVAGLVAGMLNLEGRAMTGLAKVGLRLPGLSLWALCRKQQMMPNP